MVSGMRWQLAGLLVSLKGSGFYKNSGLKAKFTALKSARLQMKDGSPNPEHYPDIVHAKILKFMPLDTGLTSSKSTGKTAGGGLTSRPPKADADTKGAKEQDKEKAKAAKATKAAEKGTERKAKAEERVNARFRAMTGAVVQQITPTLEALQI